MHSDCPLNLKYEKLLKEFHAKDLNLKKDYYTNKANFETSKLLEFFKDMPKGVLNHVHFPAFHLPSLWLDVMKFPEVVQDLTTRCYSVIPLETKLDSNQRR